ncbi:MAG TPA: hypothetical protein PKO23_16480 [Candidatus Hydrogenedentes bacterium]|nr:hypothetical protein [Candidatus Hydrogenedentota bacterium]
MYDYVYLFIFPVFLSGWVVLTRTKSLAIKAGSYLLAALLLGGIGLVCAPKPDEPDADMVLAAVGVLLFIFGPVLAPFLLTIPSCIRSRPVVLALLTPLAYWMAFVIGVNIWLGLGYRI